MRRTPAAALLALLLPLMTAATPVARVLQEDPPLPGEPLVGWEALAEPVERAADKVVDLDEAAALAVANNPELRLLRAAIDAARGDVIDARGLPNPVWEVELVEREGDKVETGLHGVGVELDVTDVILAPVRMAAATPGLDAARLRYEEGALQLGYAVRAAWYDHAAAVVAWEASIRSVDALAAMRDTARAMVDAGNVPVRDLVLRETAYEESRIRAAELELDVVAARERLTRLVGAPIPIATGLPPAPEALELPEDLESAAVGASLALAAADAEIRAALRTTTAIRTAALVPDLDVYVESERLGDAWGATAGIGVSVPLFSWGIGDTTRASATVDALRAGRDRIEIDVRSTTREAAIRLESAHRRARHYEDVLVPVRERALRETLLQYNAMQVGIDVLLDAWRARVEVEIGRADTLRELWTARAAVDALLAGARVDTPRAAASSASSPAESGGH